MENSNKYLSHIKPTWCPGCGNFGIFTSLKNAFKKLDLDPSELAVVTDVGCSGNTADFLKTYVFHALHGRALPPAAGIKLANHKLKVVAIIGDGGCYGEGLGHYINLMRGNHDITVLVHDNSLYSLTTGQTSPTTPKGIKTKSSPNGVIEEPLNPLALALANSASFCARTYALDIKDQTNTIIKAISHSGFSLIDILQPCITFNKTQTIKWYQERVYKLKNRFKNKEEAFKETLRTDKLGTGIFWQEKRPAYHQECQTLKNEALVAKNIKNINLGELIDKLV
ncbi:2-oxoacid ferredoxin oxidoreductase [Candidatus Beckwithbacteria bacterium CG10_big_fil_rev_8_21_14_0_10_34_10]|uniref:2-oxoacid ferredoxin oxidoreductase n=1 Tax=Candidatus Beckwithbacteria bacterium CG10_big_fil_rev_8_21_14_0_10_34_10 TaxID=1974495 RepID=A0A2H0WAD7_9BACT|nr:MAG: 2-oxoacid ferredoxin oxidoreductase [Candidatus Beckwithbacteria bacterium CG10_big_fil_rev_8_21_14_0_10_34_10]